MTYIGKNPIVKLTEKIYETGVKVGKKVMQKYHQFVERMPTLEKWFLTLSLGYSG